MNKPLTYLTICAAFAGSTLLLSCKNDSEKEFDKLHEEKIVLTVDGLPRALVKAINDKQPELVKRLLFAGASPNSTDERGTTALQLACASQNVDIVAAILACSPDVNLADRKKQTALYSAISVRHAAMVETLVKAGANLQVTDAKGYSPLAWACSLGAADMVTKLLELGADPNQKVPAGCEPVCVAVNKNACDVFTILLQKGADIQVSTAEKKSLVSHIIDNNADVFMQTILNVPDLLSGAARESAIQGIATAISMGHEEVVTTLLAAGLLPPEQLENTIKQAVMTTKPGIVAAVMQAQTGKEPDAENPWVKAAHILTERHKLVQEGIISSKELVHPKTKLPRWGQLLQETLLEAITQNNAPLVQRLLAAGASPYTTGEEGSAVFCAISQDNEEILQLLYDAGAPLDERGKPHALGEAAKRSSCKCIELMLNAGVPPDACAPADRNQTPLRRALENKCADAASILIESGADLNNVYPGAHPIAFSVIDIQNLELLDLMLRLGLHPDTYVYETGETLLMRAAASATPAIMELLIRSGANPHETNSVGSTPAMYAAAANKLENLELLKSKGCNLRLRNHLGFDVARFSYDNIPPEGENTEAQAVYDYLLKAGAARRGKFPYGRYARNTRATLDSDDPARAQRNNRRMQTNRQGSATP